MIRKPPHDSCLAEHKHLKHDGRRNKLRAQRLAAAASSEAATSDDLSTSSGNNTDQENVESGHPSHVFVCSTLNSDDTLSKADEDSSNAENIMPEAGAQTKC